MAFPPPVQELTAGGTAGNGITFGAGDGWEPPAPGNLILIATAFSVGNRTFNLPSDYEMGGRNSGGGGGNRPAVLIYGKAAVGDETTVPVPWSGGAAEWCAMAWEYDSQGFTVDPAKLGNGGNTASTSTIDCGETSSVEGFALALFASHEYNAETPSLTGGFTWYSRVLSGGDSNLVLDIARNDANRDVANTYNTTATWTTNSARAGICAAADVVYINGEKLKDYQHTKTYGLVHVVSKQNVWLDLEAGALELKGLNRGQARKHRAALLAVGYKVNLKTDDAAVAGRL